jgi:hypothetical protein
LLVPILLPRAAVREDGEDTGVDEAAAALSFPIRSWGRTPLLSLPMSTVFSMQLNDLSNALLYDS